MRRVLPTCVAVLTLLSICAAQTLHPCSFAGTTVVGHSENITIERTAIIEKKGTVEATVFIPSGEQPVPGIIFTHSAIHGRESTADLRRFALALSHAGAAFIVLDGTIEWQWPNDDSIRPTEFQFCAGLWLMRNVNLDLTREGEAGTSKSVKVGHTPEDMPHCGEPARCWRGTAWAGFGQISQVESRNTDQMLTPEGQIQMAKFFQKELGLKPIDPQWLAEAVPTALP
jgi:hypothetical protein